MTFVTRMTLCLKMMQRSKMMEELRSQLTSTHDKDKRMSQDLNKREEHLVVLRVELAALKEKQRLTQEESDKMRTDLGVSRTQHQACLDEVCQMRMCEAQ